MTDTSNDNKTGYKNPPKETQFKSGTSGNPKGRPKGSKNVKKLFEAVSELKVPVKDGGDTSEICVRQAIVNKLASNAMGGDHKAISKFLDLAEKYDAINDNTDQPCAVDVATMVTKELGLIFGGIFDKVKYSKNKAIFEAMREIESHFKDQMKSLHQRLVDRFDKEGIPDLQEGEV